MRSGSSPRHGFSTFRPSKSPRPVWRIRLRSFSRKDRDPTRKFRGETNVFRVLIKTLLNAGLITERTRAFYAMYVDIEELRSEGDKMVGDDIAEEGIRYLQEINFADKARQVLIAAE